MRILLAFVLLFVCWTATQVQARTLRPGDNLAITVLQDPKLDRQMIVGPDGMISFPLAGQIRASGRTTQQIERILRSRLRNKFTDELDVNVTSIGLGSQGEEQRVETKPRFYVTGEVRSPGAYPLRVQTDIVQGIALAGGLGPFASRYRIQIRRKVRGVEEFFVFNYAAYEAGSDLGGNMSLRSGDTIIVPERGLFGW